MKIAAYASLALVALALASWLSVDRLDPLAGAGKAFFSIDDGKTFFEADALNIPPFQHEGKPAVRALVYTADGGKARFVGYLMRYTPRGIEIAKAMRDRARAGGPPSVDPELSANCEIKKPGAPAWTPLADVAASAAIMNVQLPGNPTAVVETVDP